MAGQLAVDVLDRRRKPAPPDDAREPAPAALAYLANPRHRAPRVWPLRTEVGAAIEAALKALNPEQRRLVENPGSTLAELLTAFG